MKKPLSFEWDKKRFMTLYYLGLGLILLFVLAVFINREAFHLLWNSGVSTRLKEMGLGAVIVPLILLAAGIISFWLAGLVLIELWLGALKYGEDQADYQGKTSRLAGLFILAVLAAGIISFIASAAFQGAHVRSERSLEILTFLYQVWNILVICLTASPAVYYCYKYIAFKTFFRKEPFLFNGNWSRFFIICFLICGISQLVNFGLTYWVSHRILMSTPDIINLSPLEYMARINLPSCALSIGALSLTQGFFYFFVLQWAVNLTWEKRTIRLNLSISKDMGFFFVQTFLLFITFGFYGPAYLLKMARYLLPRVTQTDKETGEIVPVPSVLRGESGKALFISGGRFS